MKDKISLTGYDDALINIIRNAKNNILKIANSKKEYKIPFVKIPLDAEDQRNKRLSQSWVKYLAYSLEEYFRKDFHSDNVFAFPANPEITNRPKIKKRNEFLYDISVGEYYSFKSSINKSTIWFQAQPLWQVESEFSNNMREIAIDFSKLLAGNATFQMMVGPAGDTNETPYLTDMAQLANHCNSVLYFLFLSHPSKWYGDGRLTIKWKLYKWDWTRWYRIRPTK